MNSDQAKALKRGTILHYIHANNADGTPMRFRVNGQVKAKRNGEFRIPLKRGMYEYGYLTHNNVGDFVVAD